LPKVDDNDDDYGDKDKKIDVVFLVDDDYRDDYNTTDNINR